MRDRIANFGLLLATIGLVSSVIQLFNWELKIFRYLNEQGPVTAWGVRIGCLVGGMMIFVVAHIGEKAPRETLVQPQFVLQGIAQDPHMTHLLRGVYQSTGATLAGAPNGARIVNLFFMQPGGYSRSKVGAVGAIALIEGPHGRLQGTYLFASNSMHVAPIDDATWEAYESVS